MRGKDGNRNFRRTNDGITPAYAGKRYLCFGRGSAGWDHPRLCGEKSSRYSMEASYSGSPPPMRGKVKIPVVVGYKNRITPAYAGKSPEIATVMVQPQDHPRLCGEKETIKVGQVTGTGSPPPMRGKVDLFSAGMRLIRITPAYAGKSHSLKPLLLFNLGSPPPMRGKVAIPA